MSADNSILECAALIKEAQNIAALTGAGVSTKAGIPDFRGPQGLYITRKYDPEKIFDIHCFHQDPKPFYQFARDFISLEEKIDPTFTHRFLSQLENAGKFRGIVTQNIDALHQKAGSKNVYEMHGSISKAFCMKCSREYLYEKLKELLKEMEIPQCPCGGIIKPDIVFFGENVKYLDESAALAGKCDLFFVLGTSCVVYPAAMIPEYCTGKIIIINKGNVGCDLKNVVLNINEDVDSFFEEVNKHLN